MFTILICGIPIAIDNHYSLSETICSPFKTNQKPIITVTVTSEEIQREKGGSLSYSEFLCIHRKIALSLIKYDAFLIHAAAIDIDGHGIAFSAPSGTGKTTRVMLWQDAFGERMRVINGDKPILRFIDDKLLAFGTPWMGKEGLGCNSFVPLEYVCFIERSERVSLTRLHYDDIVPLLFQQVLFPKDKSQIERFMNLMEKFVYQVSFYLLKCNLEKEDPVKIWNEMINIRAYEIENDKGEGC